MSKKARPLAGLALASTFAGLFALFAFGGASCSKPKAGDKCENGQWSCTDARAALYCANGTWQAETCKGPSGCQDLKGAVKCDITGNVAGDVCPAALEGKTGCRVGNKERLTCKGGKYEIEECKGADGCTLEQSGMATCDPGAPKLSEACKVDERIQRCSEDAKSFLQCRSGKWTLAQPCPGSNGCVEKGGGLVSCDPSGAKWKVGDACFFITSTCSDDGAALLECSFGALVKKQDCPGPERCLAGTITCDTGVAKLGDPCDAREAGATACADDGKALLECKAPKDGGTQTWAEKKKCKTSCTAQDGKLDCK